MRAEPRVRLVSGSRERRSPELWSPKVGPFRVFSDISKTRKVSLDFFEGGRRPEGKPIKEPGSVAFELPPESRNYAKICWKAAGIAPRTWVWGRFDGGTANFSVELN